MSIKRSTDKDGNTLPFRTLCGHVTDDNNVTLSSKITGFDSLIDEKEDMVDDAMVESVAYASATNTISLKNSNNDIVSSVKINNKMEFNVKNVTNATCTFNRSTRICNIKWTDPSDVVSNGVTLSGWKGTKVVYKIGSAPRSVEDGTLLINSTTRNQYSSSGYNTTALTDGKVYFFRFFPYGETMVNVTSPCIEVNTTSNATIYGIHINGADSNPATAVTYLEDAIGKNPVGMDYANDEFSWGDWDDTEFFMPRPCMLKYDGTVDYYLDPTDYTKKADGTASDIANTSYAGNAMMEWGRNNRRIWYKIVPDSTDPKTADIYFSDLKIDADYRAWSFYDCNNSLRKHFYTPIYNGSNVSSRLRSLSGQTTLTNTDVSTEWTYIRSNNTAGSLSGDRWFSETYSDRILITYLLVLLGKSLDIQTVFGYGYGNSNNSGKINTGTMNDKGLFWGENGGTSGVKVFGMENFWGNVNRRVCGYLTDGYTQKFKLTYNNIDGSGSINYNTDGVGYISQTGSAIESNASGYIEGLRYNSSGVVELDGDELSGGDSIYYCDKATWNSGKYAVVGGMWNSGKYNGPFYWQLANASSVSDNAIGSGIAFR